MITRIFFTLFFIALILYAPWWIAFIGVAVGVFYFRNYYEVIALGVLFDLLYGVTGGLSVGYGIMGVIGGFGIFVVIEMIKKELR